MTGLKMHCMVCKLEIEVTGEELKETADFVRKNGLDSEGYEDYLSTKMGKKCKGIPKGSAETQVDGAQEVAVSHKSKKHKLILNEESIKSINDKVKKAKDVQIMIKELEKKNLDITLQIKKLQQERILTIEERNKSLDTVKEQEDELEKLTGSKDTELWT